MVVLGSCSMRLWRACWIYTVICVGLAVLMTTGSAKAQCEESQCPAPLNTISSTVDTIVNSSERAECYDNETNITISCNRGFTALVSNYSITCDGRTGEFKDEGLCQIDMLTLILAIVLMMVILFVFILGIFLVMKRNAKRRKKAMYDTSRDVSDIIDGHDEEGGVVNIGMEPMASSPRSLIPIENPYDINNEVGTQTEVEVHYANASAVLANEAMTSGDTIDGYNGTINENGMVPSNPQAGNSTEKLIEVERDEPDGQDFASGPHGYASIGDPPLNPARRWPSDASHSGSLKARPVTAPPTFPDKSASVRAAGSGEGIPIEALYAKINKVKRASERWPPSGSKGSPRPHGRPADLDDLLNQIGKSSQRRSPKKEDSPNPPAAQPKQVEDLYAEVSEDWAGGSAKTTIPPPPAPKPVRNSSKASGRKPIKRYVPPSLVQIEDTENTAKYTEVDRSRPASSNPNLISSNFAPPSPPPVDGIDGMYAEIDHSRKSRRDAAQGDRDSPSTDEGFVEHTTKM